MNFMLQYVQMEFKASRLFKINVLFWGYFIKKKTKCSYLLFSKVIRKYNIVPNLDIIMDEQMYM